mgnify:CR=1 FL=1
MKTLLWIRLKLFKPSPFSNNREVLWYTYWKTHPDIRDPYYYQTYTERAEEINKSFVWEAKNTKMIIWFVISEPLKMSRIEQTSFWFIILVKFGFIEISQK